MENVKPTKGTHGKGNIMLRMIATGTYIMSLAMLVLSLFGILEVLDFNAMAGIILYFILQEVSEFTATIVYTRESEEE
jgi:hypothetical protein